MSTMTLHDRVEFALRDAGFDLDESYRIAYLAAREADAVPVAEVVDAESDDGYLIPKRGRLLDKDIPVGTKLYAAPVVHTESQVAGLVEFAEWISGRHPKGTVEGDAAREALSKFRGEA